MRLLGHRLGWVVEKIGVGALTAAADAPAQLMQLAQAKSIRMVDDQRVRVRDIQSRLDDGGAHQHIDVAAPEVADDLIELPLGHLAVRDADMRLGNQRVDVFGDTRNILNAVVHIKHLPAAQQLAAHGGGHLRVLVSTHIREHGQTILGRGGERGHLANAGDRHLQRARDGRGRQAQHVHVGAQGFERLLVLDAETLLLVDDHQPQILELDLRIEQLVRADHNVDLAGSKGGDGSFDFLGFLETAHRGHVDREALVALGERLEMLLDEQRGGHEHGHLFAVLHRLERGAHGDLRFAEAHVAADQAIHRARLLHVGLHLVDGGELVGGFLIWEGVLKLLLPRGVGAEGEAGRALAGRIQFDQVVGDFAHMLARLGFGGGPVGAAELVEFGGFGADVFAHLVELVGGDEQFVGWGAALGGGVFDDEVFARGFVRSGADGALAHFDEAANAMLFMHDVIAGFQFHQINGFAAAFRRFGLVCGAGAPSDVTLGEQRDFCGVIDEAIDGTRANGREARDAGFVDSALQAGERALRRCGDGQLIAFGDKAFDARSGLGFVATERSRGLRRNANATGAAVVHTEIGK